MQAPTDVSTTPPPPSSSSSSSPALKMGSTLMDYKTHVFNAALEGNLMGLKVRRVATSWRCRFKDPHVPPLLCNSSRICSSNSHNNNCCVWSITMLMLSKRGRRRGDTNDKIELGDNVSDKSLLFWCIWSTETMDR